MKKESHNKKTLAFLMLILGVICLGFSPIFIRWADAPGVVTSFYRMIIVGFILGTYLGFQNKTKTSAPQPQQKRDLLPVILFPILAGIGSGFDFLFWTTAIDLTTVANATLIGYIAPVWVALFGMLFLKEKQGKIFWLGLVLVFVGATIISQPDFHDRSIGRGEFLAFISSFFYASYFIFTQKSRTVNNAFFHTWLSALSSAVVLALIIAFSGFSFTAYSPTTWLTFLLAGLISQLGGYICMSYAMGALPASIVSPFMVLQPVLTAILAVPLLGEAIAPYQLIGGVAVLLGIWFVTK